MSFLHQLKNQAQALQTQQGQRQQDLAQNTAAAEKACLLAWQYLDDAARQLNVIAPAGPAFSLDGRTNWPAMKLVDFRVDARKKQVGGLDMYDTVAMGWQIVPQIGQPVGGVVRVNFPPDLERVESRLSLGRIQHERKDVRHPEKNTLLAIEFEYLTQSRGSVTITPDHAAGTLAFRLLNARGFGIVSTSWPAAQVNQALMDELAKLIVSQESRFA